jgi:Bacterial regulatory proteins, luxR family
MAEGRSNQGIAARLVVTERAVEKHVTSIFQKMGLPAASEDHRRVLAVLTYLRPGSDSPVRIAMSRDATAPHGHADLRTTRVGWALQHFVPMTASYPA